MTTTTSPPATDNETPRSTGLVPKLLTMPVIASIGRAPAEGASIAGAPVTGALVTNEGASLKVPSIQGQGVADAEIDQRGADEDLERCQRAFHHLAAGHRQFPQPDDGDQ